MRYEIVRHGAVAVALAVLAAGCSKSPTSPSGNNGGGNTATVTSVTIGGDVTISEGATSQLTATATMSDGTTQTVTGQATWRSSNTAVATVSVTGLLSSLIPGTSDISAVFGAQTGRQTAQISTAQYRVTITAQSVTALGTCDDFTQGLTSGEFAVRVLAIPTTGSQVTMDQTTGYPGSPSGPAGYNLAEGASRTITDTRNFTLNGQASQNVRIQFNATEWDEQIVIIPPSIRWIHDSNMDDRTTSRTHSYSNGSFTGLGQNTLTLGNSSCGIRLNYTVSVTKL